MRSYHYADCQTGWINTGLGRSTVMQVPRQDKLERCCLGGKHFPDLRLLEATILDYFYGCFGLHVLYFGSVYVSV